MNNLPEKHAACRAGPQRTLDLTCMHILAARGLVRRWRWPTRRSRAPVAKVRASDDSVGVQVWKCMTDREVAAAASKSSVPASGRSTATGASSRDGASGADSSVSNNEMAMIRAEDLATDNQILRDSTDSGLAASLDPLIADAAAQSPHSTRASPARPRDAPLGASPHSRRSTRAARGERERTSSRFSNAGKGKSPAHT